MSTPAPSSLMPERPPERISGDVAAGLCPSEDALDGVVRTPARLALTAALGLLDRDVDEAVRHAVALVRRLTGAPVSFFGAVGPEADHYKAIEGAGPPLADTRVIAGRTFCHYTHALGRTLAIEDTRAASPWRDVPTVQSLGVTAYLGVPVRHGGHVVGSLCAIDMQPRRWGDKEIDLLEAMAQSIERELALRAALQAARADAERQAELVLQRETLVANVLHDLATPMLSLQLSLAMLRKRHPGEAEALAGLGHATEMLRELVSGLNGRQLGRATANAPDAGGSLLPAGMGTPAGDGAWPGAGTSDTSVLDLDAVLVDVARMVEPIAARDGLRLHTVLASGGQVAVGRGELLRVAGNLLNNAMKFSRQGGTVTLASGRDAQPGWVWMSVRDEGVGMTPDEVARCTERGYSNGKGRAHSTGLGLAIAQQFANEGGGELRVNSLVDVGTEVLIRWPDRRPRRRSAAARTRPAAGHDAGSAAS
ncbi:sensor histidine kinase [Pseudacidovorax intermedius]|uniref:sensor histidine kinase n=1 Tax=Pseudacidovorax intermedius TaxID=433924 RepID=UPI00187CECCD|nr:GAF domain-containing sensor histidine kinase [Pseudacidovorax intermedius]